MRFLVVIVAGAVLGLWFGGWAGLVIGGLAGSALAYLALRRWRRRVSEEFVETTFSVMGALCKADGVVSREEVQVFDRTLTRLQLTPDEKEAAKAAFNRGKTPHFDFEAKVRAFARLAPPGSTFFQLFLQLQRMAITADGELHPTEQAMLMKVARELGLSERDLSQLEALLRTTTSPPSMRDGVESAASESRLTDAYAVLGVAATASEGDIRSAHRTLTRENQPNQLASRGFPVSMQTVVEERAREIDSAFALVKKTRQFA